MQETYEPIVPIYHCKTVQVVVKASMGSNATEMLDAQSANDSCLTGAERT